MHAKNFNQVTANRPKRFQNKGTTFKNPLKPPIHTQLLLSLPNLSIERSIKEQPVASMRKKRNFFLVSSECRCKCQTIKFNIFALVGKLLCLYTSTSITVFLSFHIPAYAYLCHVLCVIRKNYFLLWPRSVFNASSLLDYLTLFLLPWIFYPYRWIEGNFLALFRHDKRKPFPS